MKQICAILVVGAAMVLAGCGNNSNNSINGNWTAALMSSNSSNPVFNFTLSMNQNSGSNLSITNLSFTTANPCFASGSTATGGFTLSGTFNGTTSGGFQMNIQSTGSSSNQLTLQGTVSNNTITGNWTLTGTTAGCSGSGTFTMNKS